MFLVGGRSFVEHFGRLSVIWSVCWHVGGNSVILFVDGRQFGRLVGSGRQFGQLVGRCMNFGRLVGRWLVVW